jgi:hypothetical protein
LEKKERMKLRKNKRNCLLYPEDDFRTNWDLFITLVLIFTCIETPVRITFVESNFSHDHEEHYGLDMVSTIVDSLFLIDILLIFNTAYYDEDFRIIEDRKAIASNYMQSWFLIDILAIIPFDVIIGGSGINGVVRIARIGRLYKLIKLTRLLRILKIVKERSKLLKYFKELMKVGVGFERLFFFVLMFLILCHIVSCLWVLVATFNGIEEVSGSWLDQNNLIGLSMSELYLTSFYFTVTTITTVGYGDISACTPSEQMFCIIIMIIGVISFSFASGSLASILQNSDA